MRGAGWLLACVVALATGPPLAADEFDDLQNEYSAAEQKWYEAYRAAQGGDTTKSVDMDKLPPQPVTEFAGKFKALAVREAGKPVAVRALGWIVNAAARGMDDTTDAKWALAQLAERYSAEAAIKDVLPRMLYAARALGADALIALYEKVIDTNADRGAIAVATFNLAHTLSESMPRDAEKETIERAKQRGESLFRKLVKEFPNTPQARRAEGVLFERENLQIGMTAPDFEGTDENEKPIRLSHFRGKVVVIDFWGYW